MILFALRAPQADTPATFHPKIYILAGRGSGEIWVGSNNLTVGGTELNPESLVHLEFAFPEDRDDFESVNAVWDDAVELSVELSSQLLQSLAESDMVMPEVASPGEPFAGALDSPPDSLILSFPDLGQKPPSPNASVAGFDGWTVSRAEFFSSSQGNIWRSQFKCVPTQTVKCSLARTR